MATTPILGITQVTASQNSKEVTINDAIIALEAATNAKLNVNYSASTSILLSASQATRNFLFVAQSGTANSILRFPNIVNGNNLNRVFAVRNESGYQLTVQFNSGGGSTVIIPNGATRLIDGMDGANMIVAAEPATVVTFLDLTDTPASFSGQAGRFLTANVGETALEFADAATFPTLTGNAGKYLVVNGTEDGVEWIDPSFVASFLDLTDAPSSYSGQNGKLVAVNDAGTALEFVNMPDLEAVSYVTAQRWRVSISVPNIEDQVGFGEVEFLDFDGINLCVGGTATASSEAPGNEPEFAFDGDTSPANGWLSELPFDTIEWIEYEFTTPVEPRNVRITPMNNFPDFTPLQFAFEWFDGADWIEAGERIPAPWVSEESQTFKINGTPVPLLEEAPDDGGLYGRKEEAWSLVYPTLTGNATKVLAVNDEEDDVEWVEAGGGGEAEYPDFTGNAGRLLAVNDTEDGVEWVSLGSGISSLTATGTGSSQVIELPVAGLLDAQVFVFVNGLRYETDEYSISGDELTVTTNAAGDSIEVVVVVGVESPPIAFSEVKTEATADTDLLAADAGKYIRFTNSGAKTLTVQDDADEPQGDYSEWHIRNANTGDLTLVEDTSVTINVPYGGTLVIAEGMSVTLKRVTTDEYDLIGQTVAA